MKVVTIVGARPQFIKAATISRALRAHASVEEIIVHTGQHFDDNMSDVFFREMRIPLPHHHLAVHSLTHGAMTGRMMEGIEAVLLETRPSCVLVYGDTNSTLAGALAARKLNIPVVHVEAGLRSFEMRMPEEINRVLTDRISHTLYVPTETALTNLQREGFDNFDCRIVLSGDVMEDAARFYLEEARDQSTILERLGLAQRSFYLCTLHRAENTDDVGRLREIVAALNQLTEQHTLVVPLHPRTRAVLAQHGIELRAMVVDPLGYLDMIMLLSNAALVLTDSGGLQKEAYFFNVFCVTLRDQTEWVELVQHEYNILAGASCERILAAVQELAGRNFVRKTELYGGGRAATLIAQDLAQTF